MSMSKLNITFIIGRFMYGGTEKVLIRYLKNIDFERYNPTLLVMEQCYGLEHFVHDVPQQIDIKHVVSNKLLMSLVVKKQSQKLSLIEKLVDVAILCPIRQIIKRIRTTQLLSDADIVVDFDSTSYSYLRHTHKPKITFFHFSISCYYSGNKWRESRLGRRLDTYDKVVMISQAMKEEAENKYPFLKDKLTVIYNPIDSHALSQQASAQTYLLPTEPYILSAARLDERQKDFTTLIRAYKIANNKLMGQMPHLYIIGKGKDEQKLIDMTNSLEIANKVHFMGFFSNPIPFFAHAQTFVLSSKFEGLPTVLLEALFSGCTLVATNCPTGPSEILDNGKCGLLVPVGNADALADALITASTNKQLCSQLKLASETIKKQFSVQASFEHFNNLCSELIG